MYNFGGWLSRGHAVLYRVSEQTGQNLGAKRKYEVPGAMPFHPSCFTKDEKAAGGYVLGSSDGAEDICVSSYKILTWSFHEELEHLAQRLGTSCLRGEISGRAFKDFEEKSSYSCEAFRARVVLRVHSNNTIKSRRYFHAA